MKILKLTSVAAFALAILTTSVVLAQTPGEFELRYNVDASSAAQQILSGETYQYKADCDQDGDVDFLDIAALSAILSSQ